LDTAVNRPRRLRFSSVLRSPWLRPLNDADAWEQMLAAINPMWSMRGYPARVIAMVDETADTRSFVLKPVRRWPGHSAGQHVVVEVEIDGRRLHRSFSLSSAPTPDRRIRITVKRQPGAHVSGWLHDHVSVGDVLRLSAPSGHFRVPQGAEPLLLVSAGSGITPLMSIVEDLQARGDRRPVVFIHCCRTRADFIFGDRLRQLAQVWPPLDLRVHCSAQAGRFDAQALARALPDFQRYQALVCGPRGLTDDIEALYRAAGVPDQVRSESYSGRVLPRGAFTDATHAVHCSVTEQVFTTSSDSSLLADAEAAGLTPAHGCRIGICKTCQCTKRSGTVENLRTGEISSEPDQLIQLCVSVARSPLELVL
jgi:ferredoxin-NADP reductase